MTSEGELLATEHRYQSFSPQGGQSCKRQATLLEGLKSPADCLQKKEPASLLGNLRQRMGTTRQFPEKEGGVTCGCGGGGIQGLPFKEEGYTQGGERTRKVQKNQGERTDGQLRAATDPRNKLPSLPEGFFAEKRRAGGRIRFRWFRSVLDEKIEKSQTSNLGTLNKRKGRFEAKKAFQARGRE